jgi:hypothetical protein
MDTTTFWKLIESSKRKSRGDDEAQRVILEQQLGELDEAEIVNFDRIFGEFYDAAYTWELWGAAYILSEGCSDDGFADFRGWLVSRGRKVYEAAMQDPDSLAKVVSHDDCAFGECQYAAADAWAKKTGKLQTEFPQRPFEAPRSPSGKRWPEEEIDVLKERFPKLFKKFFGSEKTSPSPPPRGLPGPIFVMNVWPENWFE